MMNQGFTMKRPDCPACGKEEGAYMCSTAWGHDISCCSDDCGYKIKTMLNINTNKKEFRDAIKKMNKYKDIAAKIKYDGIGATEFADSLFD